MDVLRRLAALVAAAGSGVLAWQIGQQVSQRCATGVGCGWERLGDSQLVAERAWQVALAAAAVMVVCTLLLAASDRLGALAMTWSLVGGAGIVAASRAVPGIGWSPEMPVGAAGGTRLDQLSDALWNGPGNAFVVFGLVLVVAGMLVAASRPARAVRVRRRSVMDHVVRESRSSTPPTSLPSDLQPVLAPEAMPVPVPRRSGNPVVPAVPISASGAGGPGVPVGWEPPTQRSAPREPALGGTRAARPGSHRR